VIDDDRRAIGHVNICLSKVILDMKDYVKSLLPLVSCSERIFGY
jgi:hypothetical protein